MRRTAPDRPGRRTRRRPRQPHRHRRLGSHRTDSHGTTGRTTTLTDDDSRPRPRSLDAQRHDALRNGLRRYLDSGIAGLRDKTAPHIAVTVSLDSLHAAPGSLPAVAASGARLPRSLVRRWLCDSAVTRFVLSLGHKVLAVSHTGRTLTATERRAKRLETGGCCQIAGCTRGPGHRLVPHHPTPYAAVRHHQPARHRPASANRTTTTCTSAARSSASKTADASAPHGWLPPDTS